MLPSLLALACLFGTPEAPTPTHAALASAERAFARMAAEKGTHAAFLAYLASDSVILTPRPAPGRSQHEGKAEDGSRLVWRPTRMELASSGDLGWSTGPFTWAAAGDSEPRVHGHFFSLWRRQADGSFKVILDGGIPHPKPAGEAPELDFVLPLRGRVAPKAPKGGGESLLQAEKAFEGEVLRRGWTAALEDRGTLDLRVYRSGTEPGGDLGASLPLVGRARLASAEVLGSGQSEAGDLGYAYGTGTQAPETAGGEPSPLSFLRVWRHVGGRWKVAVDLQLPLK